MSVENLVGWVGFSITLVRNSNRYWNDLKEVPDFEI